MMRVSIDKNDIGYIPDAFFYTVFFDGKKLDHCVMADDVSGECIIHVTDDKGKLVLDWLKRNIKRKSIFGKVEILKEND